MPREYPLTTQEKKFIRQLAAQGLDASKIAAKLRLHKRQVAWEINHVYAAVDDEV